MRKSWFEVEDLGVTKFLFYIKQHSLEYKPKNKEFIYSVWMKNYLSISIKLN